MSQWQQITLKRSGRHSDAHSKYWIMTLAQNVKKEAMKISFAAAGITNLDGLRDLPCGNID
jgi:hypothetical protein